MQGAKLRVQRRVAIAAAVIIFDDLFESGNAAVVHIGGRTRDFAECGCLETAAARPGIGKIAVAPGNAGVVEPLVGEVRTYMARDAVRLGTENLQAGLLRGRESCAVAVDETVEGRVAGEDGADEAGQR